MTARPAVMLVGGPDVDARLDLMKYLKRDFSVSAVGSDPALQSSFLAEGFEYRNYHLSRQINPVSDLFSLRQLVSIFRGIGPQLVHTFDTKPGVWGCLAAWMANVPIIVGTSTGLGSLYHNDDLKTRFVRPMYQRLQAWACRVSDVTIFQNPDDAREFVANGILPQEKTKVILGSGVSTELFASERISDQDRMRLKCELGIQPGELVVTMISRVMRSKGVLEFMAAAQAVRFKYPKVCFLLVGPNEEESIDRLGAKELEKLQQTVTWPGPRKDIPAVLAITDIFAFPTAYREGIPRVLLEASSMELPIITTDSPGCRELVEDGVNGILIPVSDPEVLSQAILRLIERPELRRHFGQIARQRVVERFSLAVVAKQTRGVYQQLLTEKAL
jgi:glycosyltransferase involved in cell wall biosynthesis